MKTSAWKDHSSWGKIMKLHDIKESVQNLNKGFHTNIDKETVNNNNFRRVLFTTKKSQLVVMSLQPGEDIGEETHDGDQFIRVESGKGEVLLGEEKKSFGEDDAVLIPAGMKHNVMNTGNKPLKIYAIYTPPEHEPGTVNKTKPNETETE
jgi:mannose-6-phosphate isomerase-like protein (cupin superfamily)